MKKLLLACSLIVGSCFFVSAQFQSGDVRVNVGQVRGTIDGRPVIVNPSTGQVQIGNGRGGGVTINTQTGQIGAAGTVAGQPFSFSSFFSSLFGGNSVQSGTQSGTQAGQQSGSAGANSGNVNYQQVDGTTGQVVQGTQGIQSGTLYSTNNPLVNILKLLQLLATRLVPFLIGLAVLAFFWFLIEFIWKGRDDKDAQTKARSGMGWSILALFIMVSIWGIILFLGGVTGIKQGGNMTGFNLPGQK